MSLFIEHIDQVTPDWLTSVLEKAGCLQNGMVLTVNSRQSVEAGATSDRFHLELDYTEDAPSTAPACLFCKISNRDFPKSAKKKSVFTMR